MSLQIYIQEGGVVTESGFSALESRPFVVLDATIAENYDYEAQVTRHPVEEGSDITDNYRLEPFAYTIQGLVTNHPIIAPVTQAGGVAPARHEFTWEVESYNVPIVGLQIGGPGIIGQVTGGISRDLGFNERKSTANGFNQPFDRVRGVFDAMRTLMVQKKVITIIADLDAFDNMVVRGYTVTRDQSTGEALDFTAEVRQIRVVTSSTVEVPEPKGPREVPQSKDGRRQNSAATSANASKAQDGYVAFTAGV